MAGVREPTEMELQQSDYLKSQGNKFFGNGDYQSALETYTSAIKLNPKSHVLFSNRSAAYLQFNDVDNALRDAERAIALNPYWGKAHRRRGNVLEVMGRFDEAIEAYEDAKNNEADPAAKEELSRTMKSVRKRADESAAKGILKGLQTMKLDEAATKLISREFEKRVEEGETPGDWPPIGSCARRLWLADLAWTAGLKLLSTFKKTEIPANMNAPPGAFSVQGQLQTLAEITSAALEDIRAVYMAKEDLEQLKLCYILEQQQRDAIGPNLSVEDVIATYKSRIDSGTGWDQVRPALQLSIRTALMNGLIKENIMISGEAARVAGTESGVDDLRRAVGLVEEARIVFEDVPGNVRGRTLEVTFLRGLKVRLGEALINQFNASKPASVELLNEIFEIGDWLVNSCEEYEIPEGDIPPPPGEEYNRYWGLYLPHWGYPRAMGHSFKGMVYMRRGLDFNKHSLDSRTGKKGPIVGDKKDLRFAAEEYIKAAAWLPEDDPDGALCLWYALFCMVRRGGYYLADLNLIRTLALAAQTLWIPYFGVNYISPQHVGKMASSEALRQSEGAEPETICSPLLEWPDHVAVDQDILGEVMMPYMSRMISSSPASEGGGMMLLGKVLKQEWKRRSDLGVPQANNLWDMISKKVKEDWTNVSIIYQQELKNPSGVKAATRHQVL